MKSIVMIVVLMVAVAVTAQPVQTKVSLKDTKRIEVNYNKTTNMIFPAAIASVDRGSQDVLVQKAQGADNILRVKADVKNFEETNMSVITADGKLYSFIVIYADQPRELNVSIDGGAASDVSKEQSSTNVKHYAELAGTKRGNVRSVDDQSSKVLMELKGFFVKDEVMFCKLKLANKSRIDYDIEQFHLYIRDKKKSKRTASQEIEIVPITVSGDTGTLSSKNTRTIVVAVPKFTIPDKKYLAIEVMERNGGRHLFLRAKNRHVMKASKL